MKKNIEIIKLRQFSLIVGIGFPLIIGWIIPIIFGHSLRIYTIFVGLIILVLGFLKPYTLVYPYKLWFLIGDILGWVNSKLLLGLVFILILQPISIILKLLNHDPLKLLQKHNVPSYRISKKNSKIDLTRIF